MLSTQSRFHGPFLSCALHYLHLTGRPSPAGVDATVPREAASPSPCSPVATRDKACVIVCAEHLAAVRLCDEQADKAEHGRLEAKVVAKVKRSRADTTAAAHGRRAQATGLDRVVQD